MRVENIVETKTRIAIINIFYLESFVNMSPMSPQSPGYLQKLITDVSMAGAHARVHTHIHMHAQWQTHEKHCEHKPLTTCAIALLYLLRLHLTFWLFRSSFRKPRLGTRASPSCTNLKPAAHWVTKSTQTQQSTTDRVQWLVYYHNKLIHLSNICWHIVVHIQHRTTTHYIYI